MSLQEIYKEYLGDKRKKKRKWKGTYQPHLNLDGWTSVKACLEFCWYKSIKRGIVALKGICIDQNKKSIDQRQKCPNCRRKWRGKYRGRKVKAGSNKCIYHNNESGSNIIAIVARRSANLKRRKTKGIRKERRRLV